MRSARQERPERNDPAHPTALGRIKEGFRIGAPPLVGLRATEQEDAFPAISWFPGQELAQWPVDIAVPISPQPHLGPFLGKHEELFGVYPGHAHGPKIAG